eukprot:5529354-Amphidinium_carterae.1
MLFNLARSGYGSTVAPSFLPHLVRGAVDVGEDGIHGLSSMGPSSRCVGEKDCHQAHLHVFNGAVSRFFTHVAVVGGPTNCTAMCASSSTTSSKQ